MRFDCDRCCLCLPLRYGLLFVAYLRLIIVSVIAAIKIYYEVRELIFFGDLRFGGDALITLVLLIDLPFTITFICGGHQKKVRLVKIYYIYSIVQLVIFVKACIGLAIYRIKTAHIRKADDTAEKILLYGFLIAVLPLYLILLLRLEVRNLEKKMRQQQRTHMLQSEERQPFNATFSGKTNNDITTNV